MEPSRGSIDGEGGDPTDDLGDGGDIARATFMSLTSVFADPQGTLLITDSQAMRLRWVPSTSAPATATPSPTSTWTALPPTLTRTPTLVNTPTNVPTQTATRTTSRARQQYADRNQDRDADQDRHSDQHHHVSPRECLRRWAR